MAAGDHEDCPACGASSDAERWCVVCGLDLHGSEAGNLRELASRLAATEVELSAISARRNVLAAELTRRRWASDRRAPTAPPADRAFPHFDRPARTGSSGEWSVERVRNVLLWSGATLLVLSALAFTAVAWTHLGPGGRAALLVAFTAMSGFAAASLRERRPATAGAFTGLTIALALVDWQVVRRAGIAPGVSTAAWWAIGTAVVAALSSGLARVAAPIPAYRAIALLLPASAVFAVAANANASWSRALGLALVAAGLVLVDRSFTARLVDPVARATVRVAAGTVWMAGALFALGAAVGPDTFVQTLVPAAVMLALAIAPGLVVVSPPDALHATDRAPMAFLVLAAMVGAVLTLASTSMGPIGMVTLAAVLGGIAIAVAPQLAEMWGRAAHIVGVVAGAVGVTFAVAEATVAELGPLAWLGSAWTGNTRTPAARAFAGPHPTDAAGMGWCAVGILVVAGVALALASRGRGRTRGLLAAPLGEVSAAGFGLLALVVAPIAAGTSALVACAVTTGALSLAMLGSALAVRSRREGALWSGFLVAIPAVPATGWAVLTRATSISVLSVVVASALLAAVVGRNGRLRAVHAGISSGAAIGLASVTMLASGSARPSAALTGLVAAGAVLIVGSLGRRDTADGLVLEIVGSAGMVGGVLLAVPSAEWVAAGLTAMVPLLLAASVRRDRAAIYAGAAGAAALSATWAWLATAGVTVVEAYTLPAAAIALGIGTFAWRVGRARSWLNLGPAVALALAPTLALAITRNDDGRAIAVGIAALLILLVGAWQRLQAPIVLGTITLLTLGVDKVGPQAVRMPRWVMLAIAGAVLLWVGTTFERRRDNVQRAARRLVELG